ncbi:MAG: hypothetical protein LBF40_07560, partial [Deltaproteobacteria bacterium]|nr:hypothetical protein [Deltaproteobacteria bacterium]
AKDIGFMSLIEVYGSCPTGALGYRKGAGPYELFPHFRREGAGSLLRPATGELFSSKRLVWRKERAFGHWTHKEGPSQ